ncbi:MAG: hypothetical protein WC023_11140 [Rhodocyclaceae bacterium]
MNNTPDMQTLLGSCKNGAELRKAVEELCAEFGETLNMTLLCGSHPAGKALCVVDFVPDNPNVSLCAMTLGGKVFGFNSVIFNFAPHPDFGCIRGFPAGSPACSCTPRT